ncbi:prephenate dehydrogenase [Clostridia bacterium]|nr:prephenate dehydrogenase [Clostridia bacterium]
MTPKKIGIIGLGLIGGSLAKTIHRIHPNIEILALDQNEDALRAALAEGVITSATGKITPAFAECRYIFLCAPVQKNETFLEELAPYLSESCILTDTGSVKEPIHQAVKQLGIAPFFIGGHPMAGSEMSGYENATAYLLENAYYLITHYSSGTASIKQELIPEYRQFIASLDCIPLILTPKEHDGMTAIVSHLPHVIAACLSNFVKGIDTDDEILKTVAAGGFRDMTRIASSSPAMWQEICLSNKDTLFTITNVFIRGMQGFLDEIVHENADEVYEFFRKAKDYRDSLPTKKQGSLPCVHELYCDLIDEAGGIATIATILAANHISIKNIGILHNREFEEGALRIEFYDEDALCQSTLLLRKYHYRVYDR